MKGAIKAGLSLGEWRQMKPRDWELFVQAKNEVAQENSGEVAAPSRDEFEELVKKYG